jgi:hypothetical protein
MMSYILIVKYKAYATVLPDDYDKLPILRYAKLFSNRQDAELHCQIHFPKPIDHIVLSIDECLVKMADVLFP